jgi:hypothetical protein
MHGTGHSNEGPPRSVLTPVGVARRWSAMSGTQDVVSALPLQKKQLWGMRITGKAAQWTG